MINLTLYIRPDCPSCETVEGWLVEMQAQTPHRLVKIDAAAELLLRERYATAAPVVEMGPYRLNWPFTRQELTVALTAAAQRAEQMQQADREGFDALTARAVQFNRSDRFSLWLSRHFLGLICSLLFVYGGLPFLAPVLMKTGQTLPAALIYRLYSPMCHQLAFRSFFLFGEQAFYPRAMANIPNVITYEGLMNSNDIDLLQARDFVGNETVGYKVALCERDVAIWGAMLLFGILYALTGRKLPTVPWYLWLVVGMGPIALDGLSQLPGLTQGLPSWVIMRESTPVLRAITGGLFGAMTGWYLFPMIEETARETRRMMLRKQAIAAQVKK